VVESPVPWVEGDEVRVVGGGMNGTVGPSYKAANGSLVLELSKEVVGAEVFAWVFKIDFHGGVD
jgi:alpha-L-fucosidase